MKKIGLFFFICTVCIKSFAQQPLDTLSYLQNNKNIYGLIVKQNNTVLYDQYFNHYNSDSLFNDQSLTKNVIAILIGIAIDKGFIPSVDEKIADYLPELKNDSDARKQNVTIHDIMNQASGLYHENLERLDLFLKLPDPSAYTLQQPMTASPGTEWHYNNAATHLLSVILTKATGMNTYSFAQKMLFQPLGITHTDWMKMADGYYDGSGLLSMRLNTKALIKIGELLLNKGVYNGKQIVAESWVQQLLTPHKTYRSYWGFPQSDYALTFYHFTYNNTKIMYGMGWGGQFIVIIPSLNAVIAINQNIADANAINQSIAFQQKIFPAIFSMLKK
ncbi:serine hydrolase domain-containing protein [Parafilimonas terrae]|uniref:CubicO group peptidase, beta-lactamase class C family n=1 Tax=Parafilimonas terrae TaxID=1465490 RepID=A0A1I5VAA0_9BACT|nr:serine hydrolase [Parafilimonas terrae]SFQ03866.1 CubicO group peptidase, beta-lactamase class C family [Parafilimonas terrae]